MAASPSTAERFYVVTSVFVVVAALYLARDLLIPLALAIFLAFLLAPLANRLEKLHLGRVGSALSSVALAFLVIMGLGFLITEQVISLAHQLPQYEDNVRAKVRAVQTMSSSVLTRATQSVRGLREEITTTPAPGPVESPGLAPIHNQHWFHMPEEPRLGPTVAAASQPGSAVPVRIVEKQSGPLDYVAGSITALVGPLGTAGIVVLLAIFLLIQRRDMRDRLITLTGHGQIFMTTQAFDEMSTKISRYLLMQLVVNTSYAIPVAAGLALFGIPNALLWGLVALALRFIPYLGAWITASIALLLAVAVYPSWWGPLGVLTFFVVLELFVNNVIEPWLYSVGSGLSVLGVIFSAVFWAWLWGPVGLLLATPIGVLLTVMGRYIPQMRFLEILLGGERTLEPRFRFFQRLLAMDQQEAIELAEEFRRTHSLLALYDDLIVPALQLTEEVRHRGEIDERRLQFLYVAFREIIEQNALAAGQEQVETETVKDATMPLPNNGGEVISVPRSLVAGTRVLCMPAGDEADEIAALMLDHLLRMQGYQVETAPVEYLSAEMLAEVEQTGARIVIVSALPPGAMVAARYLCKRISSRWSHVRILVGLWHPVGDSAQARSRLESCGASKMVTTYAEALVEALRAAQSIRVLTS